MSIKFFITGKIFFGMVLLNVASCGGATISTLRQYIENQNQPQPSSP